MAELEFCSLLSPPEMGSQGRGEGREHSCQGGSWIRTLRTCVRACACVRPAWFGAGAQAYPGISEHAHGEAGDLPKFLLKSICCFKNKGEVCRGAEECPKGRVQRGHCLSLPPPHPPVPRPLEARLAWRAPGRVGSLV